MTRKRAPGGGRKPRGQIHGKSSTLTTRITPQVRQGLDREAKRNNRSLSQEVEQRLRDSLELPKELQRKWGDPHVEALARLVSRATWTIEHITRKQWREDRFTADAVRSAIDRLIMELMPTNPAVVPPTLAERAHQFEDQEPQLAASYRKPSAFGISVALGMLNSLLTQDVPPIDHPKNELYAPGFYLMPNLRKQLGLKKRQS